MEFAKTPVLVQDFGKHDIEEISFGAHHSAILTTSYRVYCMGSNSKGQYGCGHSKQRDAIASVKGLEDEQISVSPFVYVIRLFNSPFLCRRKQFA